MYKLILLCLLISSSLNAQVGEEWRRFYNGPDNTNDIGVNVIADNDGNTYAACTLGLDGGIVIIKYNSNGNEIWLRRYNEPNSANASPMDMMFDNKGNIIIVGQIDIQSFPDIITLKIEPSSGTEIWRAKTNTSSVSEIPLAMCIDNSGNICITGYLSEGADNDIITLKYSSTGSSVFNRRFNGTLFSYDIGTAIDTDSSQNIYVVGQANYINQSGEYIILKYGPGGNILWGRYFHSGSNTYDAANCVSVDNSDNVIISGFTDLNNAWDLTTLKYSSSGSLLWEKNYSQSLSADVAYEVIIDEADNVYVCGKSNNIPIAVKYNSNGVQQRVIADSVNRTHNPLFLMDKHKNLYFVKSIDTSESLSGTLNFINITKFDSSGNILLDTLYKDGLKVRSLYDIDADDSENLYLTGTTSLDNAETGNDIITVKFNLSGNLDWKQIKIGNGNGIDYPVPAIYKNANLYVTGSGSYGYCTNFINLKYDLAGGLIWERSFERYPGVCDYAQASTVDKFGNVITTGYTALTESNYDIVTVKYDSNGILKWFSDFAGASNGQDKSKAIVCDITGNTYITGSTVNSSGSDDWITLKYDSDGNQTWASQYNGSASGIDNAYDIAVDHENNVYVCGSGTENSSGVDAILIKYDSFGNQDWIKKISGNGNFTDEFKKIKIDEQNNIYVSGSIYSDVTRDDCFLVKFDKNGNQIWQKTYNGSANNVDKVNAMEVLNDRIYITGESLGTGTLLDFITLEYDSFGNQLWTARYNGSFNRSDKAFAIAVDSSGFVYVTGESPFAVSNYVDFITIKYDPQGNQQWLLPYTGATNNNDRPVSIAVSENDEIFVCGTSYPQAGNQDIVTIKYSKSIGINDPEIVLPEEYILYDNFPNPFNPTTKIEFDIPVDSKVVLKIYDITGREIQTLVNEFRRAGHYNESFDGTNLTSGVYIYQIAAGDFLKSKTMVLIK